VQSSAVRRMRGRHEIGVCRACTQFRQEDHLGNGVIGRRIERMLCSGAELELSDDHDGILDLPEERRSALLMRHGLFSMIQSSRSIFCPTAGCRRHRRHRPRPRGSAARQAEKRGDRAGRGRVSVSSRGRLDFVPRRASRPTFALRLVKAFAMGQVRLDAKAARGNRAAADQCARRFTNYLTFDRARPLHVFDANKITGQSIVRARGTRRGARRARWPIFTGSMWTMSSSPTMRASNRSPNHGRASLGLR